MSYLSDLDKKELPYSRAGTERRLRNVQVCREKRIPGRGNILKKIETLFDGPRKCSDISKVT